MSRRATTEVQVLDLPKELFEIMPDGLPRLALYAEYLRLTKKEDCGDTLIEWSRVTYTVMMQTQGRA